MRIYIRHCDKSTAKTYRHDAPPLESGLEDAQALAERLVELWGRPQVIICSPYSVCRDVAIAMRDHAATSAVVKCDPLLADYVGHLEHPVEISPETQAYKPPLVESFPQFEHRVRIHNDTMRDFDRCRQPVWYITHGLVINRLLGAMGFRGNETIASLGMVRIRQHKTISGKIHGCSLRDEQLVTLKRY